MKKFKTKLGAFLLATSLLGGAIVSCGKQPTPTPQVLKYFVNVNTDTHFTTEGIKIEGYEQGETVRFKVNMTDDAWELVRVVLNGTQLTPDAQGYYSFTMPADDVEVNVVVRKKDVWTLEFSPALKKGFKSVPTAKLNDLVKVVTLEATNNKVEFNSDYTEATALDDGDEVIVVKFNGAVVLNYSVTILTPEHGELIDDPLSPKEANEKTAGISGRSTIEYYVEGTVDAGLEKKQGDDDPYVTFDMKEDDKTFKIYCANYGEGTSQEQLDYGSKVMTHGKLYHFNSTMEMSPSNIISIDNTTPVMVWADKNIEMLAPGTQGTDIGLRIAPRGSSSDAITWESSDEEIATFADGKVVAGTKMGTATLTFKSGELPSYSLKVVVSDDIHEGTEDDPLTAEQAWQMASALPDKTATEIQYYIKGVVSEVKSKAEKTDKQTEEAWGYASWYLKTPKSPFYIYSLDLSHAQYDALELGAETVVVAKLYRYGGTMENSGGSVKSVDNSKVTTLVLDQTQVFAVLSEGLELTPSLLPASAASEANLVWSSDNEAVLTVGANTGEITLVAPGVANVTVTETVSGLTATCKVTVTNNPMVVRPVRDTEFAVGTEYYLGVVLGDKVLYMNGEKDSTGNYLQGVEELPDVKAKLLNAAEPDGEYQYNLMVGDQYLSCKHTPYDDDATKWHINIGLTDDIAEAVNVKYANGNFSVNGWERDEDATTHEHKRVEMWIANQKDKSYTTFSYRIAGEVGNKAEFYILAEADALTGIQLNRTTASINIDTEVKTVQLEATPVPSTAYLKGLKWRSENGAVATVDQTGLVTGVAKGEVKIVAYIEGSDPEIKAECTVTVKDNSSIVEKTDLLNRALTGVSGTNYADWNNKKASDGSDAVYAGNSAGGNDSIQLRSDKSTAGVISTTSGGTLKKVKLTWNSNTAAGRRVNVYVSNTPFESPASLYASGVRYLTQLNIDNATGGVSELTIEGEYAYIGLRSSSGALYLTSIEITWLA